MHRHAHAHARTHTRARTHTHLHINITGNVKETCWFFVPGFQVKAPDGTVEYQISMVSKEAARGGVLVGGGRVIRNNAA